MAQKVQPGQAATLRIVDMSGGWNTAVSPTLLNNNEAQIADDVSFDQKGTLAPRKGRRKRYSEAFDPNPVSGLGAFYTKAGTANLLIAVGTRVVTDEPHMETLWDLQADWKRVGTVFEGEATADRTVGSLRNTEAPHEGNEKQTITISGGPTGGTFALTFNGATTAGIAHNASSATVQTALEALTNIEVGDVAVTGSDGGPWTVEFMGQYALQDVPLMTVTNNLTGGTSPAVSIAVTQEAYNSDITYQADTDGEWNAGTKSQVQSLNNELVLTKKGQDFTKVFDSQADWDSGTKTNISSSVDGSILLSTRFAQFTDVFDSQADFQSGVSTNVSTVEVPGSVVLARQ